MSLDARVGKRKTVNMNEDIAQELNKIANSSGKTLYSLANEIGMKALEANRCGFDLDEAVASKMLLQSAKKSRMILVNQDLWYFASTQAMRASKAKWLRLIRDSAQWQANVHLVGSSTGEFAASLKKLLTNFFWDCSEAKLVESDNGETLSLRLAFVPEMPLDHTEGLFKAFEAMFNAHHFVATTSAVEPGYLFVQFKRLNLNNRGKPSP